MIRKQHVEEYAEAVGSPTPAPGGGSVAAVCGALSASLVRMVAGLALNDGKHLNAGGDLHAILEEAAVLQNRLLDLATQDSDAYSAVVKALRMPKESPEQQPKRAEAIQVALKRAAEVPLDTMEACMGVLRLAKRVLDKDAGSAFTDAGTAGLIARSSLSAAALNVKDNLRMIKDGAFSGKTRDRVAALLREAASVAVDVDRAMSVRL